MMKRFTLCPAVLGFSFLAVGLHADGNKVTFLGQVEYLTYSDAFEIKENAFDKEVKEGSPESASSKTAGGGGFRIGALAKTPIKAFQIGGSLGYIMGPSFQGKESFSIPVFDAYGNVVDTLHADREVKDESNIWRALVETRIGAPLGEKFQARLGFGIGVAMLHVEEKTSDQIVGGATLNSSNSSLNTTKVTWEIGPAIAFVTKKVGIELALTYSQMPTAKDSLSFQEFKWNPFGVRLGVEF